MTNSHNKEEKKFCLIGHVTRLICEQVSFSLNIVIVLVHAWLYDIKMTFVILSLLFDDELL